jgi:EAL domain-containing protein (putative c-di-GMP-specific phosphodiesterase class I)
MTRNFVDWLETQTLCRPGSPPPARGARIPDVLRSGELRVLLQPIVDLQDGNIFAYEALVRSSSSHFAGPPDLFDEAIRCEVCGALGRVIRELAVEACPDYPLFLNIHPNEFDEGWLVQPDDPIFLHEHPVYLEITESVPLSHFELCTSVLQEIRGKGAALAVDDLGAGYSNLKYIADLSPEIVKLDRNLVASIDKDARLAKLVRSIVLLCVELGAKVVAEGLEEREEVLAVMEAGAHFGQGYFFARPDLPPPPVSDIARELIPKQRELKPLGRGKRERDRAGPARGQGKRHRRG